MPGMDAGALNWPHTTKSTRFSDEPLPGGEPLSLSQAPFAQKPPSAPELGMTLLYYAVYGRRGVDVRLGAWMRACGGEGRLSTGSTWKRRGGSWVSSGPTGYLLFLLVKIDIKYVNKIKHAF